VTGRRVAGRHRAGRRWARVAVWPVLVATLAGGAAGCARSTGAPGTSGDTRFVAGDGTITIVPQTERRRPVDLRGVTLEGAQLDIASLRGRVVVLNVWGSWCAPCRKEAPDLQAAAVELRPKGVEFVGINSSDKDRAQALAFQRTFGVTYPSLADDGGAALLALRGAVAPNAVPTTIVLDREGRIAARITSATTKVTVVDVVEDVLTGGGGG
jgi:thiol-disulfide isomerase/thioredoxin